MPHQKSKEGYLSTTEAISLGLPKVNVSKTGALYFYLEQWRGRVGNTEADRISKESREIGTAVHAEIEKWFVAVPPGVDINDKVQRMTSNFWRKFVIPYEVKPIGLEQSFEDKSLKLQGTFDAHITTNKGEYIADWKTSNSLDKRVVPLQLAAYCHLSGLGIWKGMVVRIDKEKDKVEIKEYEDLAPYWQIFLKCLDVAKFVKWGINE